MIYQLTWDNDTATGYVQNNLYETGHVITGAHLKPELENIEYDSLTYDEMINDFRITIDGIEAPMTDAQKEQAEKTATRFLDIDFHYEPLTLDAYRTKRKNALNEIFNTHIAEMVPYTMDHEMASWVKQEAEARAWKKNISAVTPMLDVLLVARDNNETMEELVDKIILKADAYITTYAGYLGRFQKAVKQVDAATTFDEIANILF